MNFGEALELLKQGKRVCRKGWNGKDMYLYLTPTPIVEVPIECGAIETLPTIVMKTADDKLCVGWLASQTDMLAEDWEEVQ